MEKLKKTVSSNFFLVFFSAVLSSLPYIFSGLYFLMFVSFVPFITVIVRVSGREKLKKNYLYGFSFSIAYFLISYSFFLSMYPIDGLNASKPIQILISVFAWVVASVLHSLLFAFIPFLISLFSKISGNRKWKKLVLFPLLFVIFEKITEFSQLRFPWIRVSSGIYRFTPFIQPASVIGTLGLDLIILSINSVIAGIFIYGKKKRIICTVCAFSVFAVFLLFGVIRMNHPESGEIKKVAVIQGNVSEETRGELSETKYALGKYFSETEKLKDSGVDLAVWPETAIPVNVSTSEGKKYLEKLKTLSCETGIDIFTGVFSLSELGKTENSAVLISQNNVSEIYSKRILAPFGEFMPYRSFFENAFPFLESLNEFVSDMENGESTVIIDSNEGKIGTLICFESVFSSATNKTVNDGAEVIFVITNDLWYKDSCELNQHFAHSVLRSVETGRCVVRSANTGISAVIDSAGRIKSESGKMTSETLIGEYSVLSNKTPFVRFGDLVTPSSFAVTAFIFVFGFIGERRKKHG